MKTIWKNRGFTLAEVLITLAIIGIVASITIPALINKYEKIQTVSKLQKAHSTLMNAFKLSSIENGDPITWDFGDETGTDAVKFIKKYLEPYTKISKICDPENNNECFASNIYMLNGKDTVNEIDSSWGTFVLLDGTSIALKLSTTIGDNDEIEIQQITFRFDLNGKSKPNRAGRDIFCFVMYKYRADGLNLGYLMPCFAHGVIKRNNFVKNNGSCATNKTSHGLGCAELIWLDGWKISDDYPW